VKIDRERSGVGWITLEILDFIGQVSPFTHLLSEQGEERLDNP
jgi:hypothetical protein